MTKKAEDDFCCRQPPNSPPSEEASPGPPLPTAVRKGQPNMSYAKERKQLAPSFSGFKERKDIVTEIMHTLSKEFQGELSLTRIDYLHFFFFVDSNCSNN